MTKTYTGSRGGDYGTAITVLEVGEGKGGEEYALPFVDKWEWERVNLGTVIPTADTPASRSHEWGYEGTGPADTAASILADYYGEPQPTRIVQAFKRAMVARLPRHERWTLTAAQIAGWAETNQQMIAQARAEAELDRRLQSGDPATLAALRGDEEGDG
jgi:hypothetical protein